LEFHEFFFFGFPKSFVSFGVSLDDSRRNAWKGVEFLSLLPKPRRMMMLTVMRRILVKKAVMAVVAVMVVMMMGLKLVLNVMMLP
jgi:hypothetical protein